MASGAGKPSKAPYTVAARKAKILPSIARSDDLVTAFIVFPSDGVVGSVKLGGELTRVDCAA